MVIASLSCVLQDVGIKVFVTPQIILYNDTYNQSEDSPAKEATKPTIYSVTKELFLSKKSDQYWRPIFYIALKYAPKGKRLSTIMKYYSYKVFNFLSSILS